MDGWDPGTGWAIYEEADGNHVFLGNGPWQRVSPEMREEWADCETRLRLKIKFGMLAIGCRASVPSSEGACYVVSLAENAISLTKEVSSHPDVRLGAKYVELALNTWHGLTIVLEGKDIDVYMDDALVISATDSDPLPAGGVFPETQDFPPGSGLGGLGSYICVDDIEVRSIAD